MLPSQGFLTNASDDLKQMLDAVAKEISLSEGEVLFEHGDEGDTLYALTKGSLEISIISMSGRKLALDLMREGAVFGEIALFDKGVRTATATALEDSELLAVRHGDLMREIQRAPGLAIDMITLAGRRMRWMSDQLHEQVFLPIPTRLARKVLYLTRHKTDESFVLPFSQSDLAEFVGATREAVSKTLSSWKKAEIIGGARGGLRVLNRSALREIADRDEI